MTVPGSKATGGSENPLRGIALTFDVLARSRASGAREMLLAGLGEPDGATQLPAVRAILANGRRELYPELLHTFHRLSPEACDEIVTRVDDLSGPLRELLANAAPQTRANIVEIIRRSGRVKLAYLLVMALEDKEAQIARRALEALRHFTSSYFDESQRWRAGEIELSRFELEARKYALLDPLIGLLTHAGRKHPDDAMLLAMGLDVRTNEILFAILNSTQDARSESLNRFLYKSISPQVVSFLLDMLMKPSVRNRAVAALEQRRDAPFVRELLSNPRFFTDHRVREGMKAVRWPGWIESVAGEEGASAPGPRRTLFSNAAQTLRALHFLTLAGAPPEQKRRFLEALARADLANFATGLAQGIAGALAKGRTPEEISLALVHLESVLGLTPAPPAVMRPAARPADIPVPEPELPWAHPESESLPIDAFAQFFNSYDRLDEATKLLATQTLKRLDPDHTARISQELQSLDAQKRLKAVMLVVMFHREQEVEPTLLRLASDPDKHIRATVVKTLGILEDEPAIRALLSAVTDIDRRVVANTLEAIEMTGYEELVNLVKIFAAHPNNRIRANAVKSLWTMGEASASDLLKDMLASPEELMRLSATWLLGEIDHPQRVELLAHIARADESERVRAKAKSILGG